MIINEISKFDGQNKPHSNQIGLFLIPLFFSLNDINQKLSRIDDKISELQKYEKKNIRK